MLVMSFFQSKSNTIFLQCQAIKWGNCIIYVISFALCQHASPLPIIISKVGSEASLPFFTFQRFSHCFPFETSFPGARFSFSQVSNSVYFLYVYVEILKPLPTYIYDYVNCFCSRLSIFVSTESFYHVWHKHHLWMMKLWVDDDDNALME